MAVVVGQYIVTGQNKTLRDYAFGLKYPYSFSENGLAYDNLTQLKANLKNLLSTKRGERINNPGFGTNLHTFLFEQQSDELNEKIFSSIQETVSFWIPQVSIVEIEMVSTEEEKDRGIMDVSIVFQSDYTNELFNVDFRVTA